MFVSTWTGKLCLILIPCVILIVSEVRNIVRILKGESVEEEKEPEPPASEDAGPNGPVFVASHRGD